MIWWRRNGRRGAGAAVLAGWALLLTLATGPERAAAQDWAMSQFDDGSYFSATLAPIDGPGPALVCGERSPRGLSPQATGNTEPDITPAGAFRLYLSDRAIGGPTPQRQLRDDVLIVVGGATGYRLRGLRWNAAFSTWETDLPARDPAFAAIAAAPGFELRYDGGRYQLSSDGFRAGLGQLAGYCQSMFAAIGRSWALGAGQAVAGGMAAASMRQLAEADILRGCGGPATKTPQAITPAQIDGDGTEDVILNWREVTCAGAEPKPFCGATMCAVDVYVSALVPRTGRPESLLAAAVWTQPLSNGNEAVTMAPSMGVCEQSTGGPDCRRLWYWTGSALAQLR